jgi:demethylmenaquinone methyltransferase/2-methoxy-6-polyprenyl-1,4-benzoquinol methylase
MYRGKRDPEAVRGLFDRIALYYDKVNFLLSYGADQKWRQKAVKACQLKEGGSALDVACGTGKLTQLLKKEVGSSGEVVGVDFSPKMLEVAASKLSDITFIEGDALNLPFEDNKFDAVTIAFGLRNLSDPERGISEMLRVLKPEGRIVILEFVRPTGLFSSFLMTYLKNFVPWCGGLVSGDKSAYTYLGESIVDYMSESEMLTLMALSGAYRLYHETYMFGVVNRLVYDK